MMLQVGDDAPDFDLLSDEGKIEDIQFKVGPTDSVSRAIRQLQEAL